MKVNNNGTPCKKKKIIRVVKTLKVLEKSKGQRNKKEIVAHQVCWRKGESPVRVFVASKTVVDFVPISITLGCLHSFKLLRYQGLKNEKI